MGLLRVTGFSPVWSDPVWSWPVCSGRWGGRQAVVSGCGRSVWVDQGRDWDKWAGLLPVKMGGRVRPAGCLMSGGHRGLSRGRR